MPFDRIDLDTLVELLDQYSGVYPSSPTGARGWVRARRELPKLDPEVYIEWDKTHWRYHNEKDGWTFEHHFRPVDDTTPEPPDLSMDNILAEAQKQLETERCPDCGGFHNEPEDEFLATLADAQEDALKSEGYFIMTLTPEHHDGVVIYEPRIFTRTLTKIAQDMLRAQLAHIAAQIFEEHVMTRVQDMERPDEPGR